MDTYFPDDEYQTPRAFSQQPVEDRKLADIIQLSFSDLPAEHLEMIDLLILSNPIEIELIQSFLTSVKLTTPAALLISVKSYQNAEGKERPVSWYAETDLRRALLVQAEAHGLGVYYRPIYPNPHIIKLMRVVEQVKQKYLPMSCLFIGYPSQSTVDSLARFESKVKREENSADYWSAGL